MVAKMGMVNPSEEATGLSLRRSPPQKRSRLHPSTQHLMESESMEQTEVSTELGEVGKSICHWQTYQRLRATIHHPNHFQISGYVPRCCLSHPKGETPTEWGVPSVYGHQIWDDDFPNHQIWWFPTNLRQTPDRYG